MNKRGQGGEVFRLLISAIIAFAILAILLSLIPNIGGFGSKPQEVAKTLINDAIKNPGSPRPSQQNVTFTDGENLTPSAVTSGTGITSDQICIMKGDHENTPGFEFRGSSLFYSGPDLQTSMEVICNRATSLREKNLSEIYSDSGFNYDLSESPDYARCGSGCTEGTGNTCCVIFLKYARQGS